jgi:hypothetical protein
MTENPKPLMIHMVGVARAKINPDIPNPDTGWNTTNPRGLME